MHQMIQHPSLECHEIACGRGVTLSIPKNMMVTIPEGIALELNQYEAGFIRCYILGIPYELVGDEFNTVHIFKAAAALGLENLCQCLLEMDLTLEEIKLLVRLDQSSDIPLLRDVFLTWTTSWMALVKNDASRAKEFEHLIIILRCYYAKDIKLSPAVRLYAMSDI